MRRTLRVGTRPSPLARAQADQVVGSLRRLRPGRSFELVAIPTAGDRRAGPRGSSDFTGALTAALRRGTIDLAIHSAKDLPARDPDDLVVAAYPRRGDCRDGIVVAPEVAGVELPWGARVGSGSRRRRAELLRDRPDLIVVPIHGNVDSRLERLGTGEFDAVVLAAAGLHRLGRAGAIRALLDPGRFLPSPGQGALAVVARRTDPVARAVARPLDDPATRSAVTAERALAAGLGAGCDLPLGALGRVRAGTLRLRAELLDPDGRITLAGEIRGPAAAAGRLGGRLARRFVEAGATTLLTGDR